MKVSPYLKTNKQTRKAGREGSGGQLRALAVLVEDHGSVPVPTKQLKATFNPNPRGCGALRRQQARIWYINNARRQNAIYIKDWLYHSKPALGCGLRTECC